MTPQQVFWHNLLADVAALSVGRYTDRGHTSTPNERLAAEIRSAIAGRWRAYLPGSHYHVRVLDGTVRITRTG